MREVDSDVGEYEAREDEARMLWQDPKRAWRQTDEIEVRKVLKGLSQRHGLTVREVVRHLESGLWSREHCLGAMRLQWTFEKMCDGEGFPPF